MSRLKHAYDEIYLHNEDEAWELIQERPEQFYVYVLINPLNNLPFYVGKGQGNRCFRHWNEYRFKETHYNRYLVNYMKKLAKKVDNILYVFELFTEDEEEAYSCESKLFIKFGLKNRGNLKGILCNLSMGSLKNSKALRTLDFIRRAKEIHNDFYDYSLTSYKGRDNLITVICPEHGEFVTTVPSHLKGHKCIRCSEKLRGDLYRHSEKYVIETMSYIHDGFYDYSLVKYHQSHVPLDIICPIHGLFYCSYRRHVDGSQCPQCSLNWRGWWITYKSTIKYRKNPITKKEAFEIWKKKRLSQLVN